MSGYIGIQPVPQATQTRDSFTATSGQTSFATGGYTPNFLDVYLNGVKLAAADYTASNGSDVVLASGAATGDILEVVAYTTFTVGSSFTPSIDDNGNATAITIDTNEIVLVGASSSNSSNVGHGLNPNGFTYHTRDGGEVLRLNRKSSDGDIATFRKDGTTVGSIGIQSSGFYIDGESGHEGLRFANGTVTPRENGADSNGSSDLGASNNRWKDLYLSGGIYLGGTGAANKLDDYEEGTWTPTDYLGNALTLNNGSAAQKYTKIGRQVFLDFDVTGTASTSGSQIRGLPFTAPTSYGNGGNLIQGYANGGTPANTRGHVYNNALYMYDGSTAVSWLNGRRLVGTIVYAI